jgi:nitrogenase-associated protein
MAELTFWGKPGCAGNAKQMALLRGSGHTLDVRDLRQEPWTLQRLRPFFGDTPVADWFNRSAPAVKRGELRPETLTESDAMALLLSEPLLIRRPLLECDGVTIAGFDPDLIAAWIGLTSGLPSVGEGCPRPDMPSCQPPLNAKQEHISE